MTGKLVKYEFRSSIKLMAVLWAALIVSSCLFSFSSNVLDTTLSGNDPSKGAQLVSGMIGTATGFLFFLAMMAMVVITIIIIIMRFYNGLFGSEGYLMNTLPVKPWQLITSKGIVAGVLVLADAVLAVASILILGGLTSMHDMGQMFSELGYALTKRPVLILMAAELFVLLITGILKSIYQVYASIAIGQLVNKYRLLLSLGAYIGINIALTVIAVAVMMILQFTDVSEITIDMLSGNVDTVLGASQWFMLVAFVLNMLQLAAFHVVTERLMTLKLNLQ